MKEIKVKAKCPECGETNDPSKWVQFAKET